MKRRAPLAFALLLCFCLRTDGALNGTVAIVTTIGGAPKNQLFTFLCYHLAAGFDHVFVFFDNPKSPDLAVAKAFGPEEVTPIVNGPELFENWKASRLFNKFAGFRDEEVMARQILNADWAVHESKRMGFQWLLHLDVDEAFYGEGVDVQQHFLELSARGYSQGVYLVNEGVPQKPWMSLSQGGEAFMRTTLFKRNVVNIHTPAAQQAKNEFAQTRGGAWHQGYFVGKSAGRMTHDIFPLEVTRWFVNHKGTTQAVFDVPSIRHFINLSPAAIVDKYKQIGDFSDTTWDPKRVDPAFLPHKDKFPPSSKGLQYHNYMRDVAKRGPKAVKAEVERQSLLSDYQLTKMLDTGAFFRDETLSAFIKEQCPIAQWKKNKFTGHRPRAAGTCSSDGECGLEPPTDIDATLSHGLVNPTYCKGQPTTKAGSSERVTCFLKAGPDCCAAVKASRGTLKIPNEVRKTHIRQDASLTT